MRTTSILTKSVIHRQCCTARQELERDGYLPPTLILNVVGDEPQVMPLPLPGTFQEQTQYFLQIDRQFHDWGYGVFEAVLVSKNWFVSVRESPATMDFSANEHPSFQEAIGIIGRSADGHRYTQVVQPYTLDKHNRPVWQTTSIAVYNHTRTLGKGSAGILDYLFEVISVNRR